MNVGVTSLTNTVSFYFHFQDQFFEYLYAEAIKLDNKVLLENKSKFLLVHASSGHKQVLKEILTDPAVATKLADTKVIGALCLVKG